MAARRVGDVSSLGRTGLGRLDRAVVVVASACAAMAVVVDVARFMIGGDADWLLRGVTPTIIVLMGGYQLRRSRPRADVVLAVAAVLIVMHMRFLTSGYSAAATIGLVTVGMTGALFVARRVVWYVAVFAALLMATPFLWVGETLTPVERLLEGIGPVIVFLFATWLLLWLRHEFESGEIKFRNLARSKDEFVASISHELRTPLTAVVGLAQELRDRYRDFDHAEVGEFIEIIAEQSVEVAHIVEDLLVVARDDAGGLTLDREPLDLRSEVARVVVGTPVAVDIALDEEVPATLADPVRTRQILRNLVANAHRYGGGRVRILMSWMGGISILEVRDDGPPIPVAERGSIFDPYYRSRQPRGVTASVGLGLTVSRRLARAMNGDLTYGHDGRESIFTLTLPNAGGLVAEAIVTPTADLQTTP
jgi:signal transduction histidine kinase